MKSSKPRSWLFVGCMLSLMVSCAASVIDEDYFPITQNGKFGFMDKTGKIVISPQFDSVLREGGTTFSEGLAVVKLGEKWGYIDKAGKLLIQLRFRQRFPPSLFHDGLAQVETREGAFGFIDRSGEFVKSLNLVEEHTQFSEGLAKVSKSDKFGYVDKTGRFVIEPRFTAAEDFKEGLAAARSRRAGPARAPREELKRRT